MLADFLGSIETVFTNWAEDTCRSVLLMYVKHGDINQTSCILHLVLDLKACFAAELLKGRGEVSNFGSLDGSELLLVIAFSARLSTFLLPSTPSCAGSHLICIEIPGILFLMTLTALWKASIK